jgi:hypothetical protein
MLIVYDLYGNGFAAPYIYSSRWVVTVTKKLHDTVYYPGGPRIEGTIEDNVPGTEGSVEVTNESTYPEPQAHHACYESIEVKDKLAAINLR